MQRGIKKRETEKRKMRERRETERGMEEQKNWRDE